MASRDVAEGSIDGCIAGTPGHPPAATIGDDARTGAAARRRALVEAGAEIMTLPDAGCRRPGLAHRPHGRPRRARDQRVHTECGPALVGALLESALVDEIVVYLAPALLGGAGHVRAAGCRGDT